MFIFSPRDKGQKQCMIDKLHVKLVCIFERVPVSRLTLSMSAHTPARSSNREAAYSNLFPCFCSIFPSKPPIHPVRPKTRKTCYEVSCLSEPSAFRVISGSQRQESFTIHLLQRPCIACSPQNCGRWSRRSERSKFTCRFEYLLIAGSICMLHGSTCTASGRCRRTLCAGRTLACQQPGSIIMLGLLVRRFKLQD